MKVINAAKSLITDVRTHWKKPREGEYVPYKEWVYLILGYGGSTCAASAGYNLSFSAGCMFVGAIYGLKMMDFAMMGIVNMVLNYLFQPINMIITDNLGAPPKKTMRLINWASLAFLVLGIGCFFIPQQYFEGFMPAFPQVLGTKFLIQVFSSYYNILVMRKLCPKFGKYRVWIIANTIPYILSLMLLVWFPYNQLEYHDKFWVMNLFFAVWGCFGSCFAQQTNMTNIVSPNSNERMKIMSYGSFAWSLFPSIYNIVWPILAALTGGFAALNTYRIAVPLIVIIFAPMAFFLAFGVKDRVVQEAEHKPQVDMKKGFKEVLRNKYLWINNISSWATSFSAGVVTILNIAIIYSMRQDWAMSITSTILGTASVPGMFIAPILIKRFDKKRVVLVCKYASVLCSLLTMGAVYMDSLVLIVVATYISTLFGSVVSIAQSVMNADIWDYQQYISGERLDGCMGIFGYLATPITTLSAMVVPAIYGAIGFTSDWDILYDATIRTQVLVVTVVISLVTGLLAIVPYHFYDLTSEKHQKIIAELEVRAHIKEAEKAEGETGSSNTEDGQGMDQQSEKEMVSNAAE